MIAQILVGLVAVSAAGETQRVADVSEILDKQHAPDLSGWTPPELHVATMELYEQSDQIVAAQLASQFFIMEFKPPANRAICVAIRLNNRLEDPSNAFLDSLSVLGRTFVPRFAFHCGPPSKLSWPTDTPMVIDVPWQGPIGKITVTIELPTMFVYVPVERIGNGLAVDEANVKRLHVTSIGH